MDAFDTDVLIYAATKHHLGPAVRTLVTSTDDNIGSVLLIPELTTKPIGTGDNVQLEALNDLLARFTLLPCDQAVAELAAIVGATHRLEAADAIHLATAVQAGADRFITNNKRDFPVSIEEIEIVYPDQL
jgi:predicted nucleic acid-binding protein